MELKNNLQNLIEESDSSLSSISEAISIPLSTLHGWLNGIEPKSIPQLKSLADYFGVSLEELCFGHDSSTTKHLETFERYKDEINAGTFEVILRRVK